MEAVKSQYVDKIGKCRALNYRFDHPSKKGEVIKVTVSSKPQAPFMNIRTANTVYETNNEDVVVFLRQILNNATVVYQEFTDDGSNIVGIWVSTTGSSGHRYIPMDDGSIPFDNVPATPTNYIDPLRTHLKSTLSEMQHARKIAHVYKTYAIYTYSFADKSVNPESLFIVTKKHTIDLEKLGRRLYREGNDMMYESNLLKVPNKKVKKALVSYVKVVEHNFPKLLAVIKNATMIPGYFKDISDFRADESQLIFLNQESLVRWKKEKQKLEYRKNVFKLLQPTIDEPYFYVNPNILNNKVLMIQNTSSIENAIQLIDKWQKDKINQTSSEIGTVEVPDYNLYDQYGVIDKLVKTNYHIIEYEGRDRYGAVLVYQ
jgi:hypothetical protein